MAEMEGKGYVKCRECGEEFQRITNTHLGSRHDMTFTEYVERYPDAETECSELTRRRAESSREAAQRAYEEDPGLRERRSRDATTQMQDPEQRRIRSEKMSGRELAEETKQKLSEARTESGRHSYRKLAFDSYPAVCARCGKTQEEELEEAGRSLVVHHKNGNQYDNRVENLAILCGSCHTKLHNKQRRATDYWLGARTVATAASHILNALGVDQSDENYRNTPNRVARMYREVCARCFEDDEEKISSLLGTTFPPDGEHGHRNLVIFGGIKAYSMCPHHLMVVAYEVDFGYIPEDRVLGASKIPRFIQYMAQKPMLQEDFTEEVANRFVEAVEPKALIVVVRGEHNCMRARGVKHDNDMRTSAVRGVAHPEHDQSKRVQEEFFSLLDQQ